VARETARTHSFKQERDDPRGLIGREIVPSKRLLARLRESSFTAGAPVTMDFMSSVESESPGFVALALAAGHRTFSPVFLREQPDNQVCRFRCWLRPGLNLASSPVTADDEALSSNHFSCCHFVTPLFLESRKAENPPISCNALDCRVLHLARFQPFQYGMNTCEWIGRVSLEIKT
jgi:hypothetical protein